MGAHMGKAPGLVAAEQVAKRIRRAELTRTWQVDVSAYRNGRESGYVFDCWMRWGRGSREHRFAVAEWRGSDEIVVYPDVRWPGEITAKGYEAKMFFQTADDAAAWIINVLETPRALARTRTGT